MDQITLGVQAMYTELEELRTRSLPASQENQENQESQGNQIEKLISELEKARGVSARWETKAINSTQEVAQLRQEIKEVGKWEIVDEEELTAFFPTITLGDGEDPFLSSSRRQRRLMQRLSAEGYSILKRKVN